MGGSCSTAAPSRGARALFRRPLLEDNRIVEPAEFSKVLPKAPRGGGVGALLRGTSAELRARDKMRTELRARALCVVRELLPWSALASIFICWFLAESAYNGDYSWFGTYLKTRWASVVMSTIYTNFQLFSGWKTLGPTCGIKAGLFSGSVMWMVIMPGHSILSAFEAILAACLMLGIFLVIFASASCVVGLPVACFCGACVSVVSGETTEKGLGDKGAIGCAFGALISLAGCIYAYAELSSVGVGLVFHVYRATKDIKDSSLGMILVDLSVFIAAGVLTDNKKMPQLTDDTITNWRNVVQVPKGSNEYQLQFDYIKAVASQWKCKYNFRLVLVNMYRVYKDLDKPWRGNSTSCLLDVNGGTCAEDFDQAPLSTLHLFHGTTWTATKAIVHDGFRLPLGGGVVVRSGSMFGKGIYFADTPHKSWQYTSGSQRLMLMSRVELGATKIKKHADRLEQGSQCGIFSRMYHSVTALTHEQGGDVRVPEYIVYDPRQAQVEYILQLREAIPGDLECEKI